MSAKPPLFNLLPSQALSHRRVLELFAGIGGLACAWPEAEIVAAIDINTNAANIYRQNFPRHSYLIREIEALSTRELSDFQADFWWLSPPCQPFSRRGRGRDSEDPRTAGLLRLVRAIGACRPACMGLENVLGFEGSRADQLLLAQLRQHGYHWRSRELCPTQLGWPNRRPRFYLLASLEPLPAWQPLPHYATKLSELVDGNLAGASTAAQPFLLGEVDVRKYASALDRVECLTDASITACFAGSYGKTLLHAGSVLRWGAGYRRFSPYEVARLLGFPEWFQLAGASPRGLWKLLGNSLSLPALRYVLSHVEGGLRERTDV